MIKYRLLFIISLFFLSITSTAQDSQPVQFSFEKESKGNGEFVLKIKAVPSDSVQLFSTQKISDDLPVNTDHQL
jgi:hypothetical protein